MIKQILKFIPTLLLIFSGHIYAADVAAGKEKATVCVACHGDDGNSTNPIWPKLAGQHEQYIYKQLQDFHSGARSNVQMNALIATLSEEDMQDIAAFYAAQTIQLGYTNFELVTLGQNIYRAGVASKGLAACVACHGPNGAGNPLALFPSLSGQHAEYTKKQLMDFRDNKRTNDPQQMMQIVSEKMTIDEIEAVANYIQGLH